MTSCPNCDVCDYSYASPTENDPEVVLRCNSCGAEWVEPNQRYIDARKRDMEDNTMIVLAEDRNNRV